MRYLKVLLLSFLIGYTMTGCFPGRKAACRNIGMANIEQSYKCLVGLKIKTALEKLQMDTSAVRTIEEPMFIIRGVEIKQGDSLVLRLYTKRTPDFPSKEKKRYTPGLHLILDNKVIGASWRNPKAKRGAYTGKVVSYYEKLL